MRALAALLALSSVAAARADEAEPPSKKAAWLADKEQRAAVHATKAPDDALHPLTLMNLWTNESLPVFGDSADEASFRDITRCHYTNQHAEMDARLLDTIVRMARRFHAQYVEIVSGFRAPKYQLLLRKKGREVARDSEHPRGQAVDFRLPGVPTKRLLAAVRSLKLGGVGYYPQSQFVHADVGRVRFWRGH